MMNKRVQALFAQIEQAAKELIAEFAYLETVCQDQGSEIKRLRFEAMGRVDMRQQHTIDWDAVYQMDLPLGPGTPEVLPEEYSDWVAHFYKMDRRLALSDPKPGGYFDVTIWRWVATIDVQVGDTA